MNEDTQILFKRICERLDAIEKRFASLECLLSSRAKRVESQERARLKREAKQLRDVAEREAGAANRVKRVQAMLSSFLSGIPSWKGSTSELLDSLNGHVMNSAEDVLFLSTFTPIIFGRCMSEVAALPQTPVVSTTMLHGKRVYTLRAT